MFGKCDGNVKCEYLEVELEIRCNVTAIIYSSNECSLYIYGLHLVKEIEKATANTKCCVKIIV